MKDIPGYEGRYAVTSCGRVWSHRTQRFLKPAGGDNYQMVQLNKDGKSHNEYVHRLVAITYIPNPNNYPEVNHKDDVKYHNWSNNLEWCSRRYNVRYGNCYKAKCKPVYCIELDKTYSTILDASNELGVSPTSIGSCLKGILKTAGGFHWKSA